MGQPRELEMGRTGEGSALCQIKGLLQWGSACVWTDGQILEQFASHRDASAEAAFAALVARHGSMVLGVCRDQVCDRHLDISRCLTCLARQEVAKVKRRPKPSAEPASRGPTEGLPSLQILEFGSCEPIRVRSH